MRFKFKRVSTSMGIALTLLFAGIAVQVTDYFELFGHNSFVPLIIGLVIIVVGVFFVLFLRWGARREEL
jgi:phosphotransferase system  glucose/maltose/N-acetylglucosamine-specific IIC component